MTRKNDETILGADVRGRMLAYIKAYQSQFMRPPSIREIQDNLFISSTSVVNYHLDMLVKQKKIVRDPKIARGIRIVNEAVSQPTN